MPESWFLSCINRAPISHRIGNSTQVMKRGFEHQALPITRGSLLLLVLCWPRSTKLQRALLHIISVPRNGQYNNAGNQILRLLYAAVTDNASLSFLVSEITRWPALENFYGICAESRECCWKIVIIQLQTNIILKRMNNWLKHIENRTTKPF